VQLERVRDRRETFEALAKRSHSSPSVAPFGRSSRSYRRSGARCGAGATSSAPSSPTSLRSLGDPYVGASSPHPSSRLRRSTPGHRLALTHVLVLVVDRRSSHPTPTLPSGCRVPRHCVDPLARASLRNTLGGIRGAGGLGPPIRGWDPGPGLFPLLLLRFMLSRCKFSAPLRL
jgi:hypothetical protein